MFRISMQPDEATRNDLMTFVKGLLREAVPAALAAKFAEEGWLEDRLQAALSRSRVEEIVVRWMNQASHWEGEKIRAAIDARVHVYHNEWRQGVLKDLENRLNGTVSQFQSAVNKILDRAAKDFKAMGEDRIRQIVAEELRKRLS